MQLMGELSSGQPGVTHQHEQLGAHSLHSHSLCAAEQISTTLTHTNLLCASSACSSCTLPSSAMAAALDDRRFTATQVTPQYADEQDDDDETSQPQQPHYQQRASSDPFDEEEQERQDDQSERALDELDDEQLLDDDFTERDNPNSSGAGEGGEDADGDGGGDGGGGPRHSRGGGVGLAGSAGGVPMKAQDYIPRQLVGYTSGTSEPWMLAPSPFPLADGQLYTKIGSNSGVWEVRPARAVFQGYKLGQAYTQRIAIVNVSKVCQRLHILPLASSVVVGSSTSSAASSSKPPPSPFTIHFKKAGAVAPGMSQILEVRFEPSEYRLYEDSVRLHMLGENMVLPLLGYPAMNLNALGHTLPAHIDMGHVPVGHRASRRLELRCDVPLQFEFELRVLNPQEEFMIFPLKGIVPANGRYLTQGETQKQTARPT